jgi:hypothetical protein
MSQSHASNLASSARPGALSAELENLRQRVDHWRATRPNRGRVPEDIWTDAVVAARDSSPWFVAKTLNLRFENLRDRIASSSPSTATPAVHAASDQPAFVDLFPAAIDARTSSAPSTSTVLELTSDDGTRLVIRLGLGSPIDLHGLVASFGSRRR